MSEPNVTPTKGKGSSSGNGTGLSSWLPNTKLNVPGLSTSSVPSTEAAKSMLQGLGTTFGGALSSAGKMNLNRVVTGISQADASGSSPSRPSTADSNAATAGDIVPTDATQISKDDLLQLCMKLQTRLKSRDSKHNKVVSAYKVKREDADTLQRVLSVLSAHSENLRVLEPRVLCDAGGFLDDEASEKNSRLKVVDSYLEELNRVLAVGGVSSDLAVKNDATLDSSGSHAVDGKSVMSTQCEVGMNDGNVSDPNNTTATTADHAVQPKSSELSDDQVQTIGRPSRSGSQPELWNRVVELEQQLKQSSNNGGLSIKASALNDSPHTEADTAMNSAVLPSQSPVAAVNAMNELRVKLEAKTAECKHWQQEANASITRLERIRKQAELDAEALSTCEDKLSVAEEKIIELQMRLSKNQEQHEVVHNEEISRRDKQIEQLQTEIEAANENLKKVVEKGQGRVGELMSTVEERDKKITELETKLQDIQVEMNRLKEVNEATTMELLQVQKKSAASAIQLDEAGSERVNLRDELVEARAESVELANQVENLKLELQSCAEQAHRDGKMVSKLTTQLGGANERMMDLANKVDELESQLASTLTESKSVKDELIENHALETKKVLEKLKDREEEIETLRSSLNELKLKWNNTRDELDVLSSKHVGEIHSIREEEGRKGKIARQMLQKKDEELEVLRKRVESLETDANLGKPSERKLFEFAQSQAAREADIQMHLQSITELKRERDELTKELRLAREEVVHLQDSLVAAQSDSRRNGVDMVYLKNVVLAYMMFDVSSSERRSLTSVIAAILEFSEEEVRKTCPRATWWDSITGQSVAPAEVLHPPRVEIPNNHQGRRQRSHRQGTSTAGGSKKKRSKRIQLHDEVKSNVDLQSVVPKEAVTVNAAEQEAVSANAPE